MNKRFVATIVGAAFAIVAACQPARADMIGRYECSISGFYSQEPIGDRPDHTLMAQDYVCVGVEGLLKGAVYSAANAIEWDGPKGTIVFGGGMHRIPGGRLVTQLVEGTAQATVKDGRPVGVESSGRGVVKFASGSFAGLNGKSVKFSTTPVNPIRFNLEFTSD